MMRTSIGLALLRIKSVSKLTSKNLEKNPCLRFNANIKSSRFISRGYTKVTQLGYTSTIVP